VRVYNPQFDAHGWEPSHSVVDIVCDDLRFLVDSVRMALDRRGLAVHLVIHPVMRVVRDDAGHAVGVVASELENDDSTTNAVMHFEVDRQNTDDSLRAIEHDVDAMLDDVGHAVADWKAMRGHLQQVLEQLHSAPPRLPPNLPAPQAWPGQISEVLKFLRWVENNHFTFVGYESLHLQHEGDELRLQVRPDSGLGLLRGDSGSSTAFAKLTPALRRLALEPQLLVLGKSSTRSTVHQPSDLDCIGLKPFDDEGKVVGEHRFLGLCTSAAYNRVSRDIPLLREKVQRIVETSGDPANSHAAKAIVNILDNFPRDELFQLDEEQLQHTTMGSLHLQERRRVRLFIHRDKWARFSSCIVYVPRERFNTANRLLIQYILQGTLGA
jgi:glutamate dehydrogenase